MQLLATSQEWSPRRKESCQIKTVQAKTEQEDFVSKSENLQSSSCLLIFGVFNGVFNRTICMKPNEMGT
jgi:hypothetical protein